MLTNEMIFGGTPLLPEHFDSAVAKAVFNDRGRAPIGGGFQVAVEHRIFEWLQHANPKLIMQWSHRIDVMVVPILSPAGFRDFCCYLCEHLPQAIENMPNTRESVIALARAVHLSKFINPSALDRIHEALRHEGLTITKG